jgi:hypothetical protein
MGEAETVDFIGEERGEKLVGKRLGILPGPY